MKIYKCDFCKKEINNLISDQRKIFMNDDEYHFCNFFCCLEWTCNQIHSYFGKEKLKQYIEKIK